MIEQIRSSGDNYAYVIHDPDHDEAVLVDPVAVQDVSEFLRVRSLTPRYLINTHGHGDHTSGNRSFAQQHDLRVLCHAREQPRVSLAHRGLHDGETLELGPLRVRVLHTPGHTEGSICLVTERGLISGDTLFVAGCGNTRYGGDVRALFESITERIASLPEDLRLYPGHDYAVRDLEFARTREPDNPRVPAKIKQSQQRLENGSQPRSTLGEEKQYNPFLRCGEPSVRARLDGVGSGASDREVFRALRRLRDQW